MHPSTMASQKGKRRSEVNITDLPKAKQKASRSQDDETLQARDPESDMLMGSPPE